MLGLRRNTLSRRSRTPLNNPSDPARKSEDSLASTETMEALSIRQDAHPVAAAKPVSAISVNEVHNSDSDESSQHTVALAVTQEQSLTRTSSVQLTRVIEKTRTIRERIICELDDVDDHYFEILDIESYLEFIATERLVHMPRKGSPWDRSLKTAEFFGLQLHNFGTAISHFVPEDKYVSNTALAGCRMLLELGHNNAVALKTTFDVLFEFGLLLFRTQQQHELFNAPHDIKEDLGDLFESLVELVSEIAIFYRNRISSMSGKESMSINFAAVFRSSIGRVWQKKEDLSNHMWSSKLGNRRFSMSIEQLRGKLSPVDHSLQALLFGRLADKAERAEGTCEWVQGELLDFLRGGDRTFTITGASGCGKSMLARWIEERLQRPLGRVSYETLSYTFASDARREATPLALLKSLLSQLLERSVGDIKLYEQLVKTFEAHSKNAKELETALWDTLKVGLNTIQEQKTNMVILIDGFDEISGHEGAVHLHKHIHECISEFGRVRAITLSKPISHLGGAGSKHLVITPENNRHDITAYLRQSLLRFQHFKSQSHGTQEKFIDALAKKSKGSFLWAYLIVDLLSREKSYGSLSEAGHTAHDNVHGLLHHNKVDLKNAVTKYLFEFMLAAERPFTVAELQELLNVDHDKRTITTNIDVRKHIASHCSVFVVVRKDLVRFKHSAIRKFILDELCGKALLSLPDAHVELTKRLLFYARYSLTADDEPTFDVFGSSVVEETFGKHLLLEYAVRYWLGHFRSSKLYGQKGQVQLSSDFKDLFPESTFFGMLEWTCWQSQWSVTESISHHDLVLHIRKACFGEKHRSVMQTMIVIGSLYRSMSNLNAAAGYFYHASIVGQAVLYKFSTVVVTCTSSFLNCTERIEVTTRTEIVTYRETMIRFMTEICKTKHGASSDQVIKWYEVLCKLYVDLKEEHKATLVYKELYEIVLVRFGKSHPKTRGISETLGGLTVVLNGGSKDEIELHDEWVFETSEDMDVTHELRISIILRLCKSYEVSGKFLLAEKLYINLWRRISEVCRIETTIDLQITKINIALVYIGFLHRIKRVEEAQSILICTWAEFEHHSCDDETLIVRIRELGVLFKVFGLLTVAVSVFAKVWGWFKAKGTTTHKEALSTTVLITEVIEEIEETTVTTKKTTTTVTTVTESVVREVFETHFERCRHSAVDAYFFKACMSLIKLYVSQGKWTESEVVIKRSLELTWKAVLTVDAKLTISGTFIKEIILVATQLALCYHRQKYFEKAEEIYLRIYRACCASFSIDHVCVTEASLVLIGFYEEFHRHDKVIEIYVELLAGCRKHCGASHHLTIKTLYALGSINLLLGRKNAYGYYAEIVTILNKGIKHCHKDAFEAAIILCRHYHEEKRWTELREICAVLWHTFVHHHHEFTFTEEMIITLYERYTYVLEFHTKVEFSVLHKLTIEYRETVITYFGVSATIVIKAMIALAMVCEKHKDHLHESITIYEEVIKRTKTVTTTTTTVEDTTITTVKRRLSKVYVTIITTGKSTDVTTIDRGITICLEIYEQLKFEFGCWHEKTLAQLREVVILYHKHGKHESTIVRMLQAVVIETFTKVTTSITLYHAAATLASIYVEVGLVKQGHDLLHQLRHLVILHDMTASFDIMISLGGKVSKVAFVFLIAFEQGLTSKHVLSFSEVMADILLETYLYEEYTRVIRSTTTIEVKLQTGAALYAFWIHRSRSAQAEILARTLFGLFKSNFGGHIGAPEAFTYTFFLAFLVELGVDRRTVDFGHLVCVSGEAKVAALLKAGEFQAANDVATAVLQLISSKKYLQARHNISHGYGLAKILAGIDAPQPTNEKLRAALLATSRTTATAVLNACRDAHIDFAALKFTDLVGLVRLLGVQENYLELEFLLLALWNSREVQRNWSPETVLSIGKHLVHAHYSTGHMDEAIGLCDTISYNLRRSKGWLYKEAIEMSELLAELYTEAKRYADAMEVHEEVLREIDEDEDMKKGADAGLVHGVVDLLKRDHARLGGWKKSERGYVDLVARVGKKFDVKVQGVEHWKSSGGADNVGRYKALRNDAWQIDAVPKAEEKKKADRPNYRRGATRRSYGFGQGFLLDQSVY
ncbi:hypothetical protein MMC25_005240 [Agyrium rufum]|nr:hypothetical protein [Agyrium rufum]